MAKDSVCEWYGGRSVFITGGTGYMGKVLVEKLLRSCDDIKSIYILCRPKRGFSPDARIEQIRKLAVSESEKKKNGEQKKKKKNKGTGHGFGRTLDGFWTAWINVLRVKSGKKRR